MLGWQDDPNGPLPGPVCGLDEVGRGALAGPLVAAAVILEEGFSHRLLRDSKLLSEAQRERVEPQIRGSALSLQVVAVGPELIDRHGVGWANRWAFERLMEEVEASVYLLDGNLRLASRRPYRCIVGGDRLVPAISAASIVAKVYRDRLMGSLHGAFPAYGWVRNKGYGSPEHLGALVSHGATRYHRRTFLHQEPPQLF